MPTVLAEWINSQAETVEELASRLGVHRTSLHRYMSGAHMPRPAMAARIIAMTGGVVTVADLAAGYRSGEALSGYAAGAVQ